VARKSIARNSAVILVDSLDEAVELANGPEHLLHDTEKRLRFTYSLALSVMFLDRVHQAIILLARPSQIGESSRVGGVAEAFWTRRSALQNQAGVNGRMA
jgi:hypothetical protein